MAAQQATQQRSFGRSMLSVIGAAGIIISAFTTTVRSEIELNFDEQVKDASQKAPKPTLVKTLIASEGLKPIRLHTQGDDFFKDTYFLRRGDADQKEGVAPPSFLQVLSNSAYAASA